LTLTNFNHNVAGSETHGSRRRPISVFRRFLGNEFGGLRQHALQRFKTRGLILSHCRIDFFGKRPRIVDRCLDFHFWWELGLD
jgi:hypothetical protein